MRFLDRIIQDDMENLINESYIDSIKNESKIMITGCNGMIATYLLYFFCYLNDKKNKNIKIYALTRNLEKTNNKYADILQREDVEFICHDVNDKFDFDFKIDYLFHLASSADPTNILNRPVDIIKANTIGLINALEFSRKNNAKLIFASTREVYGKVEGKEEIYEDDLGIIDQMGTRACYPESKKMAECLINSYNLQYNVPFTIFRIAHSYGPGMPINNDGRIMSDLIGNVVRNEDIVLKSDGSAIRAFCYLTDLISGLLYGTFVGNDNELYNLSNEQEEISILNLSNLLVSIFPSKNLTVTYKKATKEQQAAYCSFKRTRMNTDKLRKLGWQPKISLKKGLEKTVNSFKED